MDVKRVLAVRCLRSLHRDRGPAVHLDVPFRSVELPLLEVFAHDARASAACGPAARSASVRAST